MPKQPPTKETDSAASQSDAGLPWWLVVAGVVVAVCVAGLTTHPDRSVVEEDDAQERFQRLVQWVVDAGGFVSQNLEYVADTPKGAMLRARAPIQKGERLMLIPEAVQISDDNARQNAPEMGRMVDSIPDLSLSRSGVALMAAWLSNQYEKYIIDPTSVGGWRAFWDMFRPPSLMPFYRNKKDLPYLFGSFEFKEISRVEFWYGRDHNLITSKCASTPRTCAADVGQIQLGTYQAMNQFILSHACKGPGDKPRILPVFEVLNHSPELAASASYALDVKTGSAEVLATRAIDAGEEITISYGRNSNPERLANWGFTDPPFAEPFWSVRIFTKSFAENYFPDMNVDDMEIDVRLATSWHKSLPDKGSASDSADQALRTLREDLERASGKVPSFVEVVEAVADHFLQWYQQDASIAGFRTALEETRKQNPQSSVWWATGDSWRRYSRRAFIERLATATSSERAGVWEEAGLADTSDPQSTGNFWSASAARVKMSEYLCALAYKEALQYLRGAVSAEEAMVESVETAEALFRHIPDGERQQFKRSQ